MAWLLPLAAAAAPDRVESARFRDGPLTVELGSQATLQIPDGFRVSQGKIPTRNALWHFRTLPPKDGTLAVVVPRDHDWHLAISFEAVGLVTLGGEELDKEFMKKLQWDRVRRNRRLGEYQNMDLHRFKDFVGDPVLDAGNASMQASFVLSDDYSLATTAMFFSSGVKASCDSSLLLEGKSQASTKASSPGS